MLELALKAGLPIIGVSTDDPINFPMVLRAIALSPEAGEKNAELTRWVTLKPGADVYWTDNHEKCLTAETYTFFHKQSKSLVVLNPPPDRLCFDAGILAVPEALLLKVAKDALEVLPDEAGVAAALRGLSLKSAYEILELAKARGNTVGPNEIRGIRATLFGTVQGLYPEETSYDFYVWPQGIKEWVQMNKPYFHHAPHPKLMPRGILFDGPPGVGKSMAAKAISNELGAPLYRLDMASTLSKYIGESEARLVKILQMVDRESPCVLLLDEVEKIFKVEADSGVIQRLLSALLWWLQEHKTRVFTVMTTNDKSAIPPELYRKGRIDLEAPIRKLTIPEAATFCQHVYRAVVGTSPDLGRLQVILSLLHSSAVADAKGVRHLAHAEVAETVYFLVKKNQWV